MGEPRACIAHAELHRTCLHVQWPGENLLRIQLKDTGAGLVDAAARAGHTLQDEARRRRRKIRERAELVGIHKDCGSRNAKIQTACDRGDRRGVHRRGGDAATAERECADAQRRKAAESGHRRRGRAAACIVEDETCQRVGPRERECAEAVHGHGVRGGDDAAWIQEDIAHTRDLATADGQPACGDIAPGADDQIAAIDHRAAGVSVHAAEQEEVRSRDAGRGVSSSRGLDQPHRSGAVVHDARADGEGAVAAAVVERLQVQVAADIQRSAGDRAILDGDVLVVAAEREEQTAALKREFLAAEIDRGGDWNAVYRREVGIHCERVHRRVHGEAGHAHCGADVVRGERLAVEEIRRVPRKPGRIQRSDTEHGDIAGILAIHHRPRADDVLAECGCRGDDDVRAVSEDAEGAIVREAHRGCGASGPRQRGQRERRGIHAGAAIRRLNQVLALCEHHGADRLRGGRLRPAGVGERSATHGDRRACIHTTAQRKGLVVIHRKPRVIDADRGRRRERAAVEQRVRAAGKDGRAGVRVRIQETVRARAALEEAHRTLAADLRDHAAKAGGAGVLAEDERRRACARVRECTRIALQCRTVATSALRELRGAIQIDRGSGCQDQELIRRQRVVLARLELHRSAVDDEVAREGLRAEVRVSGAVVRRAQLQRTAQPFDKPARSGEQAAHGQGAAGIHREERLSGAKGERLEVHNICPRWREDRTGSQREIVTPASVVTHRKITADPEGIDRMRRSECGCRVRSEVERVCVHGIVHVVGGIERRVRLDAVGIGKREEIRRAGIRRIVQRDAGTRSNQTDGAPRRNARAGDRLTDRKERSVRHRNDVARIRRREGEPADRIVSDKSRPLNGRTLENPAGQ